MNEKTFKYIVGKNSIVNAAKDSDKDGVMDIVDCDPKDPNKQGWIHNLGAKIAEKVGATETAERIRERGVQSDEIKELARQERFKQEKETAVYREQQRAESQRKQIKSSYEPKSQSKPMGSGFGGFVKSFQTKPKRVSSTAGRKTGYKKVTKYVKQGGHYVKKTYYKPTYSKAKRLTVDKNRDGIPDIFGVRSDRNRDGKIDVLGLNRKKGKQPGIFNMRFY